MVQGGILPLPRGLSGRTLLPASSCVSHVDAIAFSPALASASFACAVVIGGRVIQTPLSYISYGGSLTKSEQPGGGLP